MKEINLFNAQYKVVSILYIEYMCVCIYVCKIYIYYIKLFEVGRKELLRENKWSYFFFDIDKKYKQFLGAQRG